MKSWALWSRFWDWCDGSPSKRTTRNTQPRQRRSGFRTSLWMSLSGPASAQTWTRSNISGETMCSNAPHPTWQSLRGLLEKNGRNSSNTKHVSSYPRRLNAVINCQRCFNKVLSKRVNTYENVIFFIHLQKKFLHCHYGVLCVDRWSNCFFKWNCIRL